MHLTLVGLSHKTAPVEIREKLTFPANRQEEALSLLTSTPAVNERLKKLEASGVIKRWAAIVDPEAVGAAITAFIEVFIEHPKLESAFIDRVSRLDEVLELHHVTGEFSVLIKARVHDMQALKELLLHQLNAQEGVRQTRTVMVLSTHKEESFVATAAKGESS